MKDNKHIERDGQEATKIFDNRSLKVDYRTLEPILKEGMLILDVGCGSGRDSLYFAKLGLEVTAIDGSATFIDIAKHPDNQDHAYQANINWQHCTFEEIRQKNWQKQFIGIWACASLLHISYEELPVLIDTLIDMLTDDGIFYVSFKYGNTERLNDNRFFCDMNEERWQTITQKVSHKFKSETWLTRDQRANRSEKWFNIMIKLQS